MRGTWKLWVYIAALGVLAGGSYLLPDTASDAVQLSAAALALGTFVAAILVCQPNRRAGWWLIALSGLLTFGQAIVILAGHGLDLERSLPSVPQLVLAIVALLSLGIGLAVLGRRRSRSLLWDTLDTSITAAAAFLLAWVFYIDPRLARSASNFETVVAIIIPAAALAVFAIGVKFVLGGGLSTWSGRALLLANAAALCTAAVLAAPIDTPTPTISHAIVAPWLVHLILLGAAGVAPGFTNVIGDHDLPTHDLPFWRAAMFVVVALVAPLNVAIGFARAQTSGRSLAAIAIPPICGTLILLILVVRLALLAKVARGRADELAQALAKRDELQQQLAYRALHDSLTGLANRDVLTGEMDRLHDTDREEREPSRRGQAVLMLDLDGFKGVNDTFGHPAGDEILVDAAQRLLATVPDESVVARLGGDEFAVLMENIAAQEARRTADAILSALRSPYCVAGHEVSLSASIGLVINGPDQHPPSSDEGLREADQALYAAKRAGRDRVTEFGTGTGVHV